MANPPLNNSYLSYKRDTSRLLYWLIQTSNSIIKNLPSTTCTTTANTTGTVTVAEIITLSQLISSHISPIPSPIHGLFRSVIRARTVFNELFQRAAGEDEEMKRSNASHKHFIDALKRALEVLGGKEEDGGGEEEEKGDVEELVMMNKFAGLNVHGDEGDSEDEEEEEEEDIPVKSVRKVQRGGAKGKKGGKKGRKGKKQKKPKKPITEEAAKEASLDDIPLESYKIIEDTDGVITEYLMACYAITKEWSQLRSAVRDVWREVAYENLNSAVAGTLSNVAIATVRRSASEVFVDFDGGHDSYETIMNTITRGDVEKSMGMFSMSLYKIPEGPPGLVNSKPEVVKEIKVDIKEELMVHAYNDLLDFLTDFQKTRTGKPTKSLLPQIKDWKPDADLQRMTKDERIKWRRAYTINWLYDLVNLFSAIVVQRNTLKGEQHLYEKVDWSPAGPWDEHRRLFGLNEFAGEITTLAMQKSSTLTTEATRKKILPHLVFQLQCIVESFTVSRGWYNSSLRGHILSPPPRKFLPRRDVDLFLDRKNERSGHGYLQAVDVLRQILTKDSAAMYGEPHRYKNIDDLLEGTQYDFINWLGESKYKYGLDTIPPSRFSDTDANGLWEYSPFLCGAGLSEALELSYRLGMKIWDVIPEPFLLVHLHNALVQMEYIAEPVGLYATLGDLYPDVFFSDGKSPTTDFHDALVKRTMEPMGRKQTKERSQVIKARKGGNIHELLDLEANKFFKRKSNLLLYREAGWDVTRIPEKDIPVTSCLAALRLCEARYTVDEETGKIKLEETDIVRRMRAEGQLSDDEMVEMQRHLLHGISSSRGSKAAAARMMEQVGKHLPQNETPDLPKGSKWTDDRIFPSSTTPSSSSSLLSPDVLLTCLKLDLESDVSGDRPLSSLNLLWVTVRFYMLWSAIETRLRKSGNGIYKECYEDNWQLMREKRASFASMVLKERDEECLGVMGAEFENPRAGFMNHIFWEDLVTVGEARERREAGRVEEEEPVDGCVVM